MGLRSVALALTAPIRVPVNSLAKEKEGINFGKVILTLGLIGALIAAAAVTNYGLKKAKVHSHRWVAYGSFTALYLLSIPIFVCLEKRKSAAKPAPRLQEPVTPPVAVPPETKKEEVPPPPLPTNVPPQTDPKAAEEEWEAQRLAAVAGES